MELTRPGARGLFPRQVVRLRHELVGLDDGQLGQSAEVGLEAPDALLGVHHRVVVSIGRLELDRQAVGDDLTAGLPLVDAGADAQDDAGEVGADHVVGQVVSLGVLAQSAVSLKEAERRHRLEDRGPDGVVVDRAGHDGDEGLAGSELGDRHVIEVQALARVLVAAGQAFEHVHFVLVDRDPLVGVRKGDGSEFLGGGVAGENGIQDLLHVGPPVGVPGMLLTVNFPGYVDRV